ncbi:single-stranded DNA-binding protein [Candidatus Pacearchaeota archaeon]|nr:single-stranded DNA-binding protein [Candidatus Pacearchaeota archaeon]
MQLNKVFIYGNITRDVDLKALPSGTQVASFSVATNRTWKDKDGAKQEDTQFHNIVVFGRQAETVAQYMKKGSPIFIEGRLQTRSWESDGVKKYRTEIVADRTQFGPKTQNTSQSSQSSSEEQESPQSDAPEGDINPDDIPF